MHIGHGGKQLMAKVTGLSPTTILRGSELKADLADCPDQHLRASGGGALRLKSRTPALSYVGSAIDIVDGWRSDIKAEGTSSQSADGS